VGFPSYKADRVTIDGAGYWEGKRRAGNCDSSKSLVGIYASMC
jgi:hypothetical protein